MALWVGPPGYDVPLPLSSTCGMICHIFRMLGMCKFHQPNLCWKGWCELFPRNGTFQELSQGLHPTSPPHWYLALLGADPTVQGQGYGSALLRHGLAYHTTTDDDPVYLDCGYENTKFYQRKGDFVILDVIPINGDANELPENFFLDDDDDGGGGGPDTITTQSSPQGVPYLFGMWKSNTFSPLSSSEKNADSNNSKQQQLQQEPIWKGTNRPHSMLKNLPKPSTEDKHRIL